MTPLRFQGGTGMLYGVLHEPAPDAFAGRGVLLCPPFGQEAIRSHRVFRVLADRLARAGIAALRFDYHGTGDADGDDDEISLPGWLDDVAAADALLRRRLGARQTVWLGLRLGAAVAALASARVGTPPRTLLLWDAVTDGPSWLAQAAASHAIGMARALPARATPYTDAGDESMGFVLPPAFVECVRRIDASTWHGVRTERLAWIGTAPDDGVPAGPAGVASVLHPAAPIDWSTDEAMNAAIVPPDVIAAVLHEAGSA